MISSSYVGNELNKLDALFEKHYKLCPTKCKVPQTAANLIGNSSYDVGQRGQRVVDGFRVVQEYALCTSLANLPKKPTGRSDGHGANSDRSWKFTSNFWASSGTGTVKVRPGPNKFL